MINHQIEIIANELCTQGYCLIEQFLNPTIYSLLCNRAKTLHQQGLYRSAKIGREIQAHHNQLIRGDSIFWLDEYMKDDGIQCFLKKLNLIGDYLNRTLFLSLKEFEAHFAAYPAGTFYKKHVDQFNNSTSRKISCVYYLNEQWHSSWGGELILYDKHDKLIKKITPQGNAFICFNSELPHEVAMTHHLRLSLAGWLKTKNTSSVLNAF